MKILDAKLKKALSNILGKKFRNEQISQHEVDLNNAAALMHQGTKPEFPLIMTSKDIYKRKSKNMIAEAFSNEHSKNSYDDILLDMLKFFSYLGLFILFAVLTLNFITTDGSTLNRMLTFVKHAFLFSFIPGSFYALAFMIQKYMYNQNIKNLKNSNYVTQAFDSFREAKKAIMVTNNSVCFIDLTKKDKQQTRELSFDKIKAVVVTSENENIEMVENHKGYDSKKEILPPAPVKEGEFQKLNILMRCGTIYSFVGPCGPNGEDAYKIAELIRSNKETSEAQRLADYSQGYMKFNNKDYDPLKDREFIKNMIKT